MSSINDINIDLSKFSPGQLETLAKIAFGNHVKSFTPYFLLSWLDTFFLGVSLIVFTIWYQRCRPTDRKWSRYLVYWCMLMITAFSGVYHQKMLTFFGSGFGRYSGFFDAVWIKVVTALGAAVRVPAMTFYLHRAWTLVNRRIWIIILVAPLIIYTAAAPIVQIFLLKMLPYTYNMRQVLATSSACEVVADTIITVTIAIQLYRSRTGWSTTDRLISRLLFTLAETQTPPTIMASMTLILFYAVPNTTVQLLVIFSPKVTCLCILFTLLSRLRIAEATRNDGNNQSKSFRNKMSGADGGRTDGTRSGGSGFTGTTLVESGNEASKGKGRWRISFGQSSAGQTRSSHTYVSQGRSAGFGAQSQTKSFGQTNTQYERGLSLEQMGRRAANVEMILDAEMQAGSRVRLVDDQVEERVVDDIEAQARSGPSSWR